MSTLTLQAPAKLNLSLRISGKREDGFHEIDTLMVKLPGLSDTLEFSESDGLRFVCDDPALPGGEENLVIKAARAYGAAAAVSCDVSISLKKSIPHGAGLGGGSSDAAAVLLGLDQLHDGKLGPERLREIAAGIGSDVPFFITAGAARCSGRGEIIEPVEAPQQFKVLLLKPAFAVATPDAYRRWKESGELPGVDYRPRQVCGLELVNDLERPVFAKHRFLAELKQWLQDRAECTAALLAGSGSTMFAVVRQEADPAILAKAARDELDPGLWWWSGMTGA